MCNKLKLNYKDPLSTDYKNPKITSDEITWRNIKFVIVTNTSVYN